MAEVVLLTREGLEKIKAEYEELISVRRAEVSERLKEAISYGDLSENAEYDAAKNEQAELEERIHKLETMIRTAKVIDESEMSEDHVNVGITTKVRIKETGQVAHYTIVGSTESDPFEGKISNESPVGMALIGQSVGSVVEIQVPDGTLHYEILEISK
ncbi:MAG: transcription elongation factor GreA [Eubacteriales bacterium]